MTYAPNINNNYTIQHITTLLAGRAGNGRGSRGYRPWEFEIVIIHHSPSTSI